MGLSNDLISQFVKVTKDEDKTPKSTTVYGTVVKNDNAVYVQIDGSEGRLTPISPTTTDVEDGDRVSVSIFNHSAVITGNLTSPSARTHTVQNIDAQVQATAQFTSIIAATLEAESARIGTLEVGKLDAETADMKYANIDLANIGTAAMQNFYAQSGLIKDVIIGDQTITGHLQGVIISGDLIEANTLKAEKLVIKGPDGLYYRINTNGTVTETEQTDQNSLNGSIIKAKSIAASKVSVTDLVAFGATIGGFHISDNSIYSGVKSSIGNTTRGIYLDNDGQVAFGDSSNFLKFYKDASGNYKLAISADELIFSASGTSVDEALYDVQDIANTANATANSAQSTADSASLVANAANTAATNAKDAIDNFQIGGRNLLLSSRYMSLNSNNASIYPISNTKMTEGNRTYIRVKRTSVSSNSTTFSLYNTINPSQLSESLSGKELTFSCLVRASHQTTCTLMHYIQLNGVVTNFPSHNSRRNLTTEWTRISSTVKIPEYVASDSVVFRFTPYIISIPADGIENLHIDVCEWKIEQGTRATDWTPAPEDVDSDIADANTLANGALTFADSAKTTADTANSTANTANSTATKAQTVANAALNYADIANTKAIEAAKTATNYMKFENNTGLIVGDMTAGTLGRNVLIDSDSVDIRNGTKTLAQYGDNAVILGYDNPDCIIDLCGGMGTIRATAVDDVPSVEWWKLQVESPNEIELSSGVGRVSIANRYDITSKYYADTMILAQSSNEHAFSNNGVIIDPRYNGTIYMMARSNDGATWGQNTQYIDLNGVDGICIAQSSTSLSGVNQTASIQVKASNAKNTSEPASITLDATDTKVTGNLKFTTNNERIWGTRTNGTIVEIFQAMNSSNNTVLGWGNYNEATGNTNVYGNGILVRANNDISIRSDGGNAVLRSDKTDGYAKVYGDEVYIQPTGTSTGESYRPYYHGVDKISSITFRGAGYVTNTGKDIYFVVPLAKPIVGAPTASITSSQGFVLRQNNHYTHGSASSTYVKPTKYSATVDASGNYVRIAASFTTTTNVVNNSPIGIDWTGAITFAYG